VLETIDHLVLTVASIEASLKFYTRCLGMTEVTFGAGRKALAFGRHKINLHQLGHEFLPNARNTTPWSADICFVASVPLEQAIRRLRENGVAIEEGPVERTGATGRIRSVYLRDPDGNLLEVAEYVEKVRPIQESGGERD